MLSHCRQVIILLPFVFVSLRIRFNILITSCSFDVFQLATWFQDSDGIKLNVGISWNGVLVYRDGSLINRFAWPRVIKLSYVRSKFYVTIRPLDVSLSVDNKFFFALTLNFRRCVIVIVTNFRTKKCSLKLPR